MPLNSYAVVTNLHNNRKVIVRINDRGPFSEKRIIDLSHSAAKELGLIARGTGQVRIEALHVIMKVKFQVQEQKHSLSMQKRKKPVTV